jgi:hypothetical protein
VPDGIIQTRSNIEEQEADEVRRKRRHHKQYRHIPTQIVMSPETEKIDDLSHDRFLQHDAGEASTDISGMTAPRLATSVIELSKINPSNIAS